MLYEGIKNVREHCGLRLNRTQKTFLIEHRRRRISTRRVALETATLFHNGGCSDWRRSIVDVSTATSSSLTHSQLRWARASENTACQRCSTGFPPARPGRALACTHTFGESRSVSSTARCRWVWPRTHDWIQANHSSRCGRSKYDGSLERRP